LRGVAERGDLPVLADRAGDVARVEHLLWRRRVAPGLSRAEQRRDPFGDGAVQSIPGVRERLAGTEPVGVVEREHRRTAVGERVERPGRVLFRERARGAVSVRGSALRPCSRHGVASVRLRRRRERAERVHRGVVELRELLGERRGDAGTGPAPESDDEQERPRERRALVVHHSAEFARVGSPSRRPAWRSPSRPAAGRVAEPVASRLVERAEGVEGGRVRVERVDPL